MQTMTNKYPSQNRRRLLKIAGLFIIAAAAFLLLFFAYEVNSTRTQSYKESDVNLNIIVGARELNKFPISLTNDDFQKLRLDVYI
jgi:hypothetical protein